MSARSIVLLVLFTLVMGLWGLALLGAFDAARNYSMWLPFFACLILGILVVWWDARRP